MRIGFLTSVVLALSTLGFAQKRDGIYQPSGGTKAPWEITTSHGLKWGDKPFMPVGISLDSTLETFEPAKAAGIKDFLIDLPANGMGWEKAFSTLNQAGVRFGLRINSLAPMAKGFIVEPQAYRMIGLTGPREMEIDIPGAKSALVVIFDRRDTSIVSTKRMPVVNGKLKHTVKASSDAETVLMIYPEASSLEQADYWEELDQHRDEVLSSLTKRNPGAGLRFIANPLGKSMSLPGKELHFVPSSPAFRKELRVFLETKYKSLETAQRVWSMSATGIESWDQLARLVPLWSGTKGVAQLWDPETDQLFPTDARKSTIWDDISDAVSAAGTRRFQRLVAAIRSVTNVPVIQEWQGWASPYETPSPAVDGVGMKSSGSSVTEIVDSGCRAASSVFRWNTKGLLLATDISFGSTIESEKKGISSLDTLFNLGVKGVYVRTSTPEIMKLLALEATKRAEDSSLFDISPQAVFFPENASNPAFAQRLPGGKWWLPTPHDGNRVDLGSLFSGYRVRTFGNEEFALWASRPGRYRLRTPDPKTIRFQTLDGSDPKPVLGKNYVDVNLSDVPILISGIADMPIPEVAYTEVMMQFQMLMKDAESKARDLFEERVAFQDRLPGFDYQPGSVFPALRQIVNRISTRVASYTWIEAEATRDHNWSDAGRINGCSLDSGLVLRTPFAPVGGMFVANYKLAVRSINEQEVWIAAKIPLERRADVIVTVGTQRFAITSEPVSIYANGFGWYKLGSTRFAGRNSNLRIDIMSSNNQEIAFDAILITPKAFRPEGPRMPDALDYPPVLIPSNLSKGGSRQSGLEVK